ncbi:MAG: hypothetical protein KJN60_13785 [Boseongicola sp.]|nr:hypothetical protein [Boseongicola sp.]
MGPALIWLGKNGRFCLIAGLLVGLLAPDLAAIIRPWVGSLIAVLLFVTAVRVGARRAFGGLDEIRATLLRIAVLQAALPLVFVTFAKGAGLVDFPLVLAVSLMLAAPSLTGAPNFAAMMGHDPAPGMRLLVLGTFLFPLTAFPVLFLLDPVGEGPLGALSLSFGLLTVILVVVGLGFTVRRALPRLGEEPKQNALDGAAALVLAVVVVGLMSAIGPLLRSDPLELAMWIATALAVNFGLVSAALFLSYRAGWKMPLSTSIYAGNRNIALFLIVLPEAVVAPLMIFVGCYQIPMYLTPVLLTRLLAIAAPKQSRV